jgi:hypothetical protein
MTRHGPTELRCRKAVFRWRIARPKVRAHLESYYSEVGRSSIDPELVIRMLTNRIISMGSKTVEQALLARLSPIFSRKRPSKAVA